MNTASRQTGGTRFAPEEELKEIQVLVEKLYPGRTFDQLSPDEQKAVYASNEGNRDVAAS